jgi:organic radical activating enzyme
MEFIVDQLTSGGIMTNYECTVRCAHCRHNASPNRTKGFISEELVSKIIRKLEALGCRSVHIEGGEPFIYPDELIRTVKQIGQSQIFLEHIVTNCSWYKNQKETKNLLKALKQYGLRRLLVKVSPFQNENIPLRKVTNVAQIADSLGINVMIWDNEVYPEVASFHPAKTHSLNKYIKKFGPDYMKKVASCFNVTFAGRTFEAYENYLTKYSLNDLLLQNKGCLHSFPTQNHFHVDMFGNFVFSHTNGVSIELKDVGQPIDPKKYPFLSILIHGGVNSLYKLATTKYGFSAKPEYLSKCHLCYEIRRFLVIDQGIVSPDLQPLGFYQEN